MNPVPLAPAPLPPVQSPRHNPWLLVAGIAFCLIALALAGWWLFVALTPQQPNTQPVVVAGSTEKPGLTTASVVGGYDHIWDIAFLPTKEMLFTERGGTVYLHTDNKTRELAKIPDVYAAGEGGLMGLEVDTSFAQNRYIYACFNSSKDGADKRDVRVVRWKLAADLKLEDRTELVTDIPMISSGRHSGCRVKMGPDSYLYIGTGDAATGGTAIDHKNLGGKVLRIDRDGGPAPGNMGGDFDPRIFSYGHRNVQGIAFFPTAEHGAVGVSVEHGSSTDDEINLLVKGNFGWAHPTGLYTEIGVPMTDKTKFPDAVDAIWSSGSPAQAPSGATFLAGSQWKSWNGALAMAMLKDRHLKILTISADNKVTTTENILINQFGRLRTAVQGPDGNLYLTTDNGNADQIIRVTPN